MNIKSIFISETYLKLDQHQIIELNQIIKVYNIFQILERIKNLK
jgi:hypothetical protein